MTHFSKFAWEDLKCSVKAVPDHPIKSNLNEHKAEIYLYVRILLQVLSQQIIDTNEFLNVRSVKNLFEF